MRKEKTTFLWAAIGLSLLFIICFIPTSIRAEVIREVSEGSEGREKALMGSTSAEIKEPETQQENAAEAGDDAIQEDPFADAAYEALFALAGRLEEEIRNTPDVPVLLRSYDTENVHIQNAAFSYDNALAAMAFLAGGQRYDAKAILDAFVYAVRNDRTFATGEIYDSSDMTDWDSDLDSDLNSDSDPDLDWDSDSGWNTDRERNLDWDSYWDSDDEDSYWDSDDEDSSDELSNREDREIRPHEFNPMRVRNAYAAGDISAFSEWDSGVKMPGWYDMAAGEWYEDRSQVGSNPGNTSYVALALLQYYAAFGGERYLDTACSLMDWVIEKCSDETDGFTAGFDGWEEADPPVVYPFTSKSIEHNIDAFAAFSALARITGETRYEEAAESARRFIESMYDAENGRFMTGTKEDGTTPDPHVTVLDAQVWSALALGDAFLPFEDALETAASMKTEDGGYPFCQENKNGGYWAEGTAFTALLYKERGDEEKYEEAMNSLVSIQLENGLFPAATNDHLSTGIELFDGSAWEYTTDPHIAPAAWFVMAAAGFNPYEVPSR